ncbi:MAG: response regulator [Deltaproteobacteria bacterium]|nr:response regulator [Deltaproteobacteria bacterium]
MEEVRVLLVDDEVEFVDTLEKRLKRRKLTTSSVNSGEDALEFLGQNPTDVVILDVKMPGIDGIQTLREIKQQYPLVEVIMLTGHANVEVAIQGMEIGAFDYLMKPMAIDDLVYKIQDAYKKKSIQERKIKERLQSSSG